MEGGDLPLSDGTNPEQQVLQVIDGACSARRDTATICVWGLGQHSIGVVWRILKQALGPLQENVIKVTVVSQRDGLRRFDVLVKATSQARCLTKLKLAKKHTNMHAIAHRPTRCPTGSRPQNQPHGSLTTLPIVSLNVGGLSHKRIELQTLLQETGAQILLLQETMRKAHWWPMRLPGYTCTDVPLAHNTCGKRGVAIAVKDEWSFVSLGVDNPFWIFGKVVGPGLDLPLIVASIYLPSIKHLKREAMNTLKGVVRRVMSQHPRSPLILAGDWNTKGVKLSRLLSQWHGNLSLLNVHAGCSPISYWGGVGYRGRQSDIDHFVVNPIAAAMCSGYRVMNTYDISDHFPILTTLPLRRPGGEVAPAPQPKRDLDRIKVEESADQIVSHNVWAPLYISDSDDDEPDNAEEAPEDPDTCAETPTVRKSARTESLAADFLGACNTVVDDIGLVKTKHKPLRFALSRATLALVYAKRAAFRHYRANPDDAEARALYIARRNAAKKACKADRDKLWQEHINKGCELFAAGGGSKQFWRWANSTCNPRNGNASQTTPIQDGNGQLLLAPSEILDSWSEYYEKLASDETTHSQNEAYWRNTTAECAPPIDGLNSDITWKEVQATLSKLKKGKAAGEDGLPPEWFKLALEETSTDSTVPQRPETPFGRALMRVLQSVWSSGHIPTNMRNALLVPIPKKGDPTLKDNYRGISLINIVLKILTTLLTTRLYSGLESTHQFSKEQGGFRDREECLGQVAALMDVIQRRTVAGKATYACFIDFKKAFDRVPHGSMLWKLRLSGVGGRMYRFVKSLYNSSTFSVHLPCGTSRRIPLKRGVRQGCPMSPCLFDLFIDDLVRDLHTHGCVIDVPGVEKLLAGFLFADDVVLLAASRSGLQKALDVVSSWGDANEMLVGQAKCGVMVFNRAMDRVRERRWLIQGAEVPVVDEYVYLGVCIHHSLLPKYGINYRVAQGNKLLHSMRPFLCSQKIPLYLRTLVYKTVCLPRYLYGGEVFGMSIDRVRSLQTAVKIAMNWMLGTGGTGRTAAAQVMGQELGIPSVASLFAQRRTRAFGKYRTLRTWIADLLMCPFRKKGIFPWGKLSQYWLKRYGLQDQFPDYTGAIDMANAIISPGSRIRGLKSVTDKFSNITFEKIWARDIARTHRCDVYGSVSGRFYSTSNFAATQSYLADSIRYARTAAGITWMARFRTCNVMLMPQLVGAKKVNNIYRDYCPCCQSFATRETYAHILLRCPTWAEHRRKSLDELTQWICTVWKTMHFTDSSFVLCDEAIVTLLLGGTLQNDHRLKSWTWCTSLASSVEEADQEVILYQRQFSLPAVALVGEFLSSVMPLRRVCLQALIDHSASQRPPG
jgi:exonuclease III